MSDMWRLFIAIEVPADIRAAVSLVQNQLKPTLPKGIVRWAKPRNIHLTLKFLGDVPRTEIESINTSLSRVTENHAPFTLDVTGLGCFPNSRRPRVLWLGLGGEVASLIKLQSDVEEVISPLGYPSEYRSYNPHLTIGRVGQQVKKSDYEKIADLLRSDSIGRVGSWRVDAVSLMRSQLKPSGAVYTRLSHVNLVS